MKDMLMVRVTQESAPLSTALQHLGLKRALAPGSYQLAHLQAPVGIQIVQHPVIADHVWELADHIGQMRREILAGPRHAQIPQHLAGRDQEGGQQGPHPMANILMFPFLWLARLYQLGRIFALQNLHAGLLVHTDDQAALLVEAQGVDIELTDDVGLTRKGRIVTIEPIDASMWFDVRLVQNPPDARATHTGMGPVMEQRRRDIRHAPSRGGTVGIGRFLGRDRHDVDPFSGGKSAAAFLGAAHLASQRVDGRDTGYATDARSDDHSASRWRSGDLAADRALRLAGSADTGTPRLGAWNAP